MKIVTFALLFLFKAPLAKSQSPANLPKPEKPWETTLYVTGGPAIAYVYRSEFETYHQQLDIFTSGASIGKVLLSKNQAGKAGSQLEYVAEFEPFWLAHTPDQATTDYLNSTFNQKSLALHLVSRTQSGIAVTPLLVRYRFPEAKRITPYVQLGGGLLFTFHDFPQPNSSVVNFTPQVDFGTHIRTRPKQAIVLGLNVEHISNAELGNINHGVNVSLIFRAGYTWWH